MSTNTPARRGGALTRALGLSRAPVAQAPKFPLVVTEPAREREKPWLGLVASARRLTGKDVDGRNKAAQASAANVAEWQKEAWELNDLIGEQRFLGNTLAGRMAQAHLYVGKVAPDDTPGTRPAVDPNEDHQRLLDAIGDGPGGQGQLLHRLGVNLFIAGEAWLVGIPPERVPGTPEYEERQNSRVETVDRAAAPQAEAGPDVLSLVWKTLSVTEVSVDQTKTATLTLEDGAVSLPVDELYLIRVWRQHPRNAQEADSPTRASLPVLRELLGLTMHVSAQIDSRLAGAGLLVVASQASAALKRAAGLPENSEEDPLIDALMETMMEPMKDRSSASAVVPLVLTVPDDVVDKVKHITFSTPFDRETPKLRDEAIRRLALGQDAPPELLLGSSGMNHWGAWLVREDVVTTHLEPPLQLVCDALTSQYLRPVLMQLGMSAEEARSYVVWYDVDHLIARPNRGSDAKDLHAAGVLSDTALREANGFDDDDAPEEVAGTQIDPAVQMVLDMVAKNGSLAQAPGIPQLVEQIRAVMNGDPAPSAPSAPSAPPAQEESSDVLPESTPESADAGTPANPNGETA